MIIVTGIKCSGTNPIPLAQKVAAFDPARHAGEIIVDIGLLSCDSSLELPAITRQCQRLLWQKSSCWREMGRRPRKHVTFRLLSFGARGALTLVLYRDDRDQEPFDDWYADLDVHAAAKVTVALARLAAGNRSETKSVRAGVLERRIDWGPGYRIYFGLDGKRLVVLLGGGFKNRQQRDIVTAHARWNDYKSRRNDQETEK